VYVSFSRSNLFYNSPPYLKRFRFAYSCCVHHDEAEAAIFPLKNMGFPDWQCRLAVMSFGSNVDAAVSWLVEGGPGQGSTSQHEAERCMLEVGLYTLN
jgi:hypothetical protein